MHEKISDVTVLTIVISTLLLVLLGGIVIYFLFAYQRKVHRHKEEIIVLNDEFGNTLLKSKLEIREQTLDHIAKEVHANISQLVSVININLSAYLQQEAYPSQNIIETKALVKQLMAEIKNLSVTLNTEHIGRAGFLTMLESELDRLTRTGLYAVTLARQGDIHRLPPEKEIILFRLCQEILNNIIKHSGADQVDVSVIYGDGIEVSIADNGNGFDIDEVALTAPSNRSTGISNIHYRTTQIEGSVKIISARGKGTSITVKIPV